MDLSGLSVLVVDDVRFTRTTLIKMLGQFGQPKVYEASEGLEALVLLRTDGLDIDLVITDLEMPEVDGIALLKAIRSGTASVAHTLPVIFLTGHSELERLGPALLLDLDAFLAKPTSAQAFQNCLEQLFSHGRFNRAATETVDYYRAIDTEIVSAPTAEPGHDHTARPETPLSIADLPEDAVLSRDLLFANGRLLLPAGTVLSPRVKDRLINLTNLSNLSLVAWVYV
jgi:two-component system chemotaxis response regulator CheY